MESLELRLGYSFKNAELLTLALTHPSISHERKLSSKAYQRLEFLGDAVVDLVISETLFNLFPDDDEGLLSKLWTRAVKTETMARIARHISLGKYLLLGRGEDGAGGRDRDSTLADSLEAVIGAVHLDGGLAASQNLVAKLWKDELENLKLAPVDMNPKGQLQEMLQIPPWGETPTYRITSSNGPDHRRHFESVVSWKGHDLATGIGRSKQEAQVDAARQALSLPSLSVIIQSEQKKHLGQ